MTLRSNEVGYIKHNSVTNVSPRESLLVGLTKEQLLFNDLNKIAQDYVEIEQIKKNFIKIIERNHSDLDFTEFISYPKYFIKERCIKKSIKATNIAGLNIITVDGSNVVKTFLDVDFSFLKAIAVLYHFNENHDAKIGYFPDMCGFNNYSVQGSYINHSDTFAEAKTSLDMAYMEINLLNEIIKKREGIDFIIIDGSIMITQNVVQYSSDLEISNKVENLLKEYQELYVNCKENNIILIGSIKDTRSATLANLIRDSILLLKPSNSNLADFLAINYRQVFEYFSDLDLFNRLLRKGERSCIFQCNRESDKIRELNLKRAWSSYLPLTFYSFYLKTAKHDTPCRIEFFIEENHKIEKAVEKAELISSILMPISSMNDFYGLPIPQIEAHKRAVFKPNEIELLFNKLKRTLHKKGVTLIDKRRNRRPF